MGETFQMLVIGDLHYDPSGSDEPQRRPTRGAELVRAAIVDGLADSDVRAVALMGDLVEDGNDPRSEENLRELAESARSAVGEVPLLVVPGNHDVDPQRLLETFGARAGGHEIAGCRLFVFVDEWWADDTGHRQEDQQERFVGWAAGAAGPVVALQHNPIYPPVENDYPYALAEHKRVRRDYAGAGVTLSLSAHYHAGLPLTFLDGVGYFTCPALHKPPHPYAKVTISQAGVRVEVRRLEAEPDAATCG